MTRFVPVMRPRLPLSGSLTGYLERIDVSRTYSNYGPLVTELEARLAEAHAVGPSSVTTVANGTLGLALALMAQDAKAGTLCLMPAWTFVASAQAAQLAGLTPYFADVSLDTWALDPAALDAAIKSAPGEVGAIMPVVPFGRPIDFAAWDQVRAHLGLPIVIDAAAAFDSVVATAVPAVVSLHATKVLGVGEGGFVLSTDPDIARNVKMRANFGFRGTRDALAIALNAKLSEYHAAVGLASLDEWPQARDEWLAAGEAYRSVLATACEGISLQPGFGKSWVSSTCLLQLAASDAQRAEEHLKARGIETRRWWGAGAHAHTATTSYPRTAVPITEHLAQSTIGVPFFRDIARDEIEYVIQGLLDMSA